MFSTDQTSNALPRGRRPTQEERRATTTSKLLGAAGRVFAERGYHAATIEEIAERAGLSKGAVYYNFESKEALFLALLTKRLEDRLGDISDERAGADSAVEGAARDFLLRVERDPRWAPLFFEFVAHAARNSAVRDEFAATFLRAGRERLIPAIARDARVQGADGTIAPAELAIAVSALTNGILIERMFDPDVADDLLGRILGLLLHGLVAEHERTG